MYNLPSVEQLSATEFNLNERDYELASNVSLRVGESLKDLPIYMSTDVITREQIRHVCLYVSEWYIKKFTRFHGAYVIPVLIDGEIIEEQENLISLLITRNIFTVGEILYFHIMYNLSMAGIFTEYWTPIRFSSVYNLLGSNDILVPVLTAEASDNIYDDVLERSFEENREMIQNKLYSENRDNQLTFSTLSPIERNEEISDCGLCCEHADYVCEKCHYPLCNSCIKHLKHSTNECPSCRCQPIILQKIIDGNEFNEDSNEPHKE